jgi:hypothetical protein
MCARGLGEEGTFGHFGHANVGIFRLSLKFSRVRPNAQGQVSAARSVQEEMLRDVDGAQRRSDPQIVRAAEQG